MRREIEPETDTDTASALTRSRSGDVWPAPVEYAVAVDRYLASSVLGQSSRRVYRISLASWAWPLADKPLPAGPRRRGAAPPVLPLDVVPRVNQTPSRSVYKSLKSASPRR